MNKRDIDAKSQSSVRILVIFERSWERIGKIVNKIFVLKTNGPLDKIPEKPSNDDENVNATLQDQRSPYRKSNKTGNPIFRFNTRKIIDAKSPRRVGTSSNYSIDLELFEVVGQKDQSEMKSDRKIEEKLQSNITALTDRNVITEQKQSDTVLSEIESMNTSPALINLELEPKKKLPKKELSRRNHFLKPLQLIQINSPNKFQDKKQERVNIYQSPNRVLKIKLAKEGPTPLVKDSQKQEGEEMPFDDFLIDARSQLSVVKKRIEDYAMEKILGQGSYAIVKLGRDRRTNQKCAIKTYQRCKLYDPERQKNVKQEISLLRGLDHPNVIKLHDIISTTTQVNLIMELGGEQSLYNYLKAKEGRKLSENEARSIFKQLVEGTRYIHEKNIVHRDLKLENALIDDKKTIKIIDFGFSVSIEKEETLKNFCGTPSYMAPEIVSRKEYNGVYADIWALGIILYIMLAGKLPFAAKRDKELYDKVKKGSFERIKDITDEAQNLISRILKLNPRERLTAEQILEDCWVKGVGEPNNALGHSISSKKLYDGKISDKQSETSEAETDTTRTQLCTETM